MTVHDPLIVILGAGTFVFMVLVIANFTIVKPSQYIKLDVSVEINHTEDTARLRWFIENKSEVMVRLYKYKIKTINDKGARSWRDHDYDVLLEGKEKHHEKFGDKPLSGHPYNIQRNTKNRVTVVMYYFAEDGKGGIAKSETEVDIGVGMTNKQRGCPAILCVVVRL